MKKYVVFLCAVASLAAEYDSKKAIQCLQDIADKQLSILEVYSEYGVGLQGEFNKGLSGKYYEKPCAKISELALHLTDSDKERIRLEWSQVALTPENYDHVRSSHKKLFQKKFIELAVFFNIVKENRSFPLCAEYLLEVYEGLRRAFADSHDAGLIIMKLLADECAQDNYTIFNEFEHMMAGVEYTKVNEANEIITGHGVPSEVLMDAFLHDESGKVFAWFILMSWRVKHGALVNFYL